MKQLRAALMMHFLGQSYGWLLRRFNFSDRSRMLPTFSRKHFIAQRRNIHTLSSAFHFYANRGVGTKTNTSYIRAVREEGVLDEKLLSRKWGDISVEKALQEGAKILEDREAPEPVLSACHILSAVLELPSNGFSRLLQLYEGSTIDKGTNGLALKVMTTSQAEQYANFTLRRAEHEPIQYIVGEWDFYDFTLKCRAPILCPRPETEELVEWVRKDILEMLEGCPTHEAKLRVLDVGCGTGAIGLALARLFPSIHVTAIDISPDAVALSTENAELLGLISPNNETACEGEGARYRAVLSSARNFTVEENAPGYDIVVSNPPYIPPDDMKTLTRDVAQYESHEALCGGSSKDGMDVIREVMSRLPDWTKTDKLGKGVLYMEVDPSQPRMLEKMLLGCDIKNNEPSDGKKTYNVCFVEKQKDFMGLDRFVKLRTIGS